VSAWSSGRGTFGIRVGNPNRDRHFDRSWTEIEVEIDGNWRPFKLTRGFWNKCPEFRDSGGTSPCKPRSHIARRVGTGSRPAATRGPRPPA
jgi:hypothetical protein